MVAYFGRYRVSYVVLEELVLRLLGGRVFKVDYVEKYGRGGGRDVVFFFGLIVY